MPGRSILIVDDSPIIAERLRNMLEGSENIGAISHAASYSSALRKLVGAWPDIVLLDINLPDGSGIDLLQHIKTSQPSTVAFMVSNQSGDYYRRVCRKMGADHFIDKSKEFEQIPAIIASIG